MMNNNSYFLLLILSLFSVKSFARQDSIVGPANRLRLDYFLPGVSYEIDIGGKKTVVVRSNFDVQYNSSKIPAPDFSRIYNLTMAELRWYCNPLKLIRKKPHWRQKSGTYLGMLGQYNFRFYKGGRSLAQIGAVYGFQRVYRRFAFNAGVGIGYGFIDRKRPVDLCLYGSLSYAF